jgi:hypothetical protein
MATSSSRRMEHNDFTYCPRHRDKLPRENALLAVEDKVRACCGGTLHPIGESVGEMLDWMAAQLRIVRISLGLSQYLDARVDAARKEMTSLNP